MYEMHTVLKAREAKLEQSLDANGSTYRENKMKKKELMKENKIGNKDQKRGGVKDNK